MYKRLFTFAFCSCIIINDANLRINANAANMRIRRLAYIRIFASYFMFEKINEPIETVVMFKGKEIMPSFFKWRNKTYKIEKLNLVHKQRDGNDKIYYFSVSDKANYFRLAFFTRDLSWRIEELFYEG